MLSLNSEVLKLDDDNESKCRGRIYRCRDSHYLNKHGDIVYKTEFIFLKSKSCSGCEHCDYIVSELSETISLNCNVIYDEIVDGGLYSLIITNITKDYESGMIDGWDLKLELLSDCK